MCVFGSLRACLSVQELERERERERERELVTLTGREVDGRFSLGWKSRCTHILGVPSGLRPGLVLILVVPLSA